MSAGHACVLGFALGDCYSDGRSPFLYVGFCNGRMLEWEAMVVCWVFQWEITKVTVSHHVFRRGFAMGEN